MTPTRKRRLSIALFILLGMGAATSLLLYALGDNLLYFQSPSDVLSNDIQTGQRFRLGGMVQPGSVQRDPDTLAVSFVVTDYQQSITVNYQGILPDLFREGQGVITNGALTSDGEFAAREVLAKHDEKYMPPEITDALERANPTGTAGGQR